MWNNHNTDDISLCFISSSSLRIKLSLRVTASHENSCRWELIFLSCKLIVYSLSCCIFFNSLWPSGSMWWLISGSTLAQIMVCCLTVPSHYLNQCWLTLQVFFFFIHLRAISQEILMNVFGDYTFKITTTSPRGQWVNHVLCKTAVLLSLTTTFGGVTFIPRASFDNSN